MSILAKIYLALNDQYHEIITALKNTYKVRQLPKSKVEANDHLKFLLSCCFVVLFTSLPTPDSRVLLKVAYPPSNHQAKEGKERRALLFAFMKPSHAANNTSVLP